MKKFIIDTLIVYLILMLVVSCIGLLILGFSCINTMFGLKMWTLPKIVFGFSAVFAGIAKIGAKKK